VGVGEKAKAKPPPRKHPTPLSPASNAVIREEKEYKLHQHVPHSSGDCVARRVIVVDGSI